MNRMPREPGRHPATGHGVTVLKQSAWLNDVMNERRERPAHIRTAEIISLFRNANISPKKTQAERT